MSVIRFPYTDFHCDTLMGAYFRGCRTAFEYDGAMASLKKLAVGGCGAQLFAIFMPPVEMCKKAGDDYPGDEAYILALKEIFENTLSEHSDIAARAENAADLDANARAGRISAILSMEDCRAVDGRFENIKLFYELGIRMMGLTWNFANCFGYPNSADPELMNKGLTDFGKEAVPFMESLGMGIDVSHLSDGGFWDIVEIAGKPFIASHSNCRALNPHTRSMTDEMIKALADKGGVMGVNFCPEFLHADATRRDSTIDGIAFQLRHRINVGGLECAAIGTDFDGIDGELKIPDASHMPRLFEALERKGFTANELDHISHLNAERVLKEILG